MVKGIAFSSAVKIIMIVIVLGIILGITWMFNFKKMVLESLETTPQFSIKGCTPERLSPEKVFLEVKGDCCKCNKNKPCNPFCNDASTDFFNPCPKKRSGINVYGSWTCDVTPGGQCLITDYFFSQRAYNDCEKKTPVYIFIPSPPFVMIAYYIVSPYFGFFDLKMYKGHDDSGELVFEDVKDCKLGEKGRYFWGFCNFPGVTECIYTYYANPLESGNGTYERGDELFFSANFVTAGEGGEGGYYKTCNDVECKRHKSEFHQFTLRVKGRYCCPEGYNWSRKWDWCCGDNGCTNKFCTSPAFFSYSTCWVMAEKGENCEDACRKLNMRCDSNIDKILSSGLEENCEIHEQAGITCNTCKKASRGFNSMAPYVDEENNCYYYDKGGIKFSCAGFNAGVVRLCPCTRECDVDFEPGTCVDSDGGIDKNKKGCAMDDTRTWSDRCIGPLLEEVYCDGNTIKTKLIACGMSPLSCIDGRCTGL
ncbi:MAG TPA: hypothetical protein ENF95_01995 [Candidatus Aenigmarchaeota archaeon]|nr:hypothetical protein [Candidatus Aenigmarchaeota archaeon]